MKEIKHIEQLSKMNQNCEAAQLRDHFNFVVTSDTEGNCVIAAFLYEDEAKEYMIRTDRQRHWHLICIEK